MSGTVQRLTVEKILAAAGAPTITAGGMKAPTSPAAAGQGAPGVTTVTYKLVSVAVDGSRSLSTAGFSNALSNATLDGTNFNRLTWTDDPSVDLDHVEVYRTVGGAAQGWIADVDAGDETLDDTGLVAGVSPILPVATTRKYKIVTLGTDGRRSVASAEGTSAVGPEALSASTPMTVDWSAVTSAQGYEVWRTDTLIAKGLLDETSDAITIFTDEGEVGDGTDPPTVDATGISDVLDVLHLGDKYIQVAGTFVASMQLQGTINGTDWVDEGAAISAAAVRAVAPSYALMRLKQTAFTSGAPTFILAGRRVAG